MANRIVIDTEVLERTGQKLSQLRGKLQQAAGSLSGIRLDMASGGMLDWDGRAFLECSGIQLRGATIDDMVQAYARGLRATGGYAQELAQAVRQTAQQTENTEHSALAMLEALKTGQEACFAGESAGGMDRYVAPSGSAYAYKREHEDEWEDANAFWDTAYNERILEALRLKILTDPKYDEDAWNALTPEQKRQRALELAREIARICGTEADVVYVNGSDTITYTDAEGNTYRLSKSDAAAATYVPSADCILIDPDSALIRGGGVSTLVSLITHEIRHSMQRDVVDASDSELREKYDVDGSDLDAIREAQAEWREEFDDYVSPNDEKQVKQRTKEIKRERSIDQWWKFSDEHISNDQAKEYAKNELEREYYEQQVEVDAMQIDGEVYEMYGEKREMQYQMEEHRQAGFYGPWKYDF